MNGPKELIFVYNADSGRWNAYLDMMHKVFSPKTYPCKLCDITYGVFSIRQEWADFIKTLPIATQFLHRDEWVTQYNRKDPLPAVFLKEGDRISVWISADDMQTFELNDLKAYIKAQLPT